MLFPTLISALALPLFTAASPITLDPRAGGPAIIPVPAACTLINPLPHASQHPGNGTISGYLPTADALTHKIYQWYIPQPDFMPVNDRWSNCIDQCNGLSGCVSAFMAYNTPLPKGWLGLPGGELEVGCLFFNRTLTPWDFIAAEKNQHVNATAGNIYCPAATSGGNASTKSTLGEKTPVKVVA